MDEGNSLGELRRGGVSKPGDRAFAYFPVRNAARSGGGIGLGGGGGNWGEGAGRATVESGAGMAVEGAEVSFMESSASADSEFAQPG